MTINADVAKAQHTHIIADVTDVTAFAQSVLENAIDAPTFRSLIGSGTGDGGVAASATKLETARLINGVPFDGTANITVADSTKYAKPAGGIPLSDLDPTIQSSMSAGATAVQPDDLDAELANRVVGSGIASIVKVTETEYAALSPKDANTLYVVVSDPVAPTFTVVGHSEFTPSGTATTRDVTLPSGIQDGDLIVVTTMKVGSANVPDITGLTGLSKYAEKTFTGHCSQVWVKQNAAAADSGATITVTTASAYLVGVQIAVLRGSLPTSGGAVDAFTNNSATSNVNAISNTPATALVNDFELFFTALSGNATDTSITISTPTGLTNVSTVSTTALTNGLAMNLSYGAAVNAGSSTAAHSAVTNNTQGINWAAWSILIKQSA